MARALSAMQRYEAEILDILKDLRVMRDDFRGEIYGAPSHIHRSDESDLHVYHGADCWCEPDVLRYHDHHDIVVHRSIN